MNMCFFGESVGVKGYEYLNFGSFFPKVDGPIQTASSSTWES